jgi:uncharacterized protein (DUF58 family)
MTRQPLTHYHVSLPQLIKVILPFFFVFAIYRGFSVLVGIILGYYVLAGCTYIYTQYITRYVQITDKKKSVYLFPGEDTELSFHVVNSSPLPIVNANYSFHMDSSICVHNEEYEESVSLGKVYRMLFIQRAKSNNEYKVQLSVSKRGVYKIERVNLCVNDIFGVATVYYPSIPMLSSEVVVYPSLKAVHHVQLLQQDSYGVDATNRSAYYDESSVVGTKKYERESFRHIHWKATAKLQQLQAKQFQPIHNKRVSILLCLTDSKHMCIRNDGEDLISYTAFICEYLTKQKMTYELFISIYTGDTPFHIPMGEGNMHFGHVLEALARIRNSFSLLPTKPFLTQCMEHGESYSTSIILGANEDECSLWIRPYYTVNEAGELKKGVVR